MPKPYDTNDPERVRAPGGVPPEALERAAAIILAARARRLQDAEPALDAVVAEPVPVPRREDGDPGGEGDQ